MITQTSKPSKRREVGNHELVTALDDSNNVRVIQKVLNRYRSQVHDDDLETCGLIALWKTLGYHDHNKGQKFTTSLHRFVHWEVRKFLRKQTRSREKHEEIGDREFTERDHRASTERLARMEYVQERIALLPEHQRVIVRLCHLEKRTLDEVSVMIGQSKEFVRLHLHHATERLQELCQYIPTGELPWP